MAWLRYWVVLSAFSMLELVLDMMMAWMPGYLIAKCVFLVWCMAPVQNNGSNIIFNMVSSSNSVNSSIISTVILYSIWSVVAIVSIVVLSLVQ